jgi:hypothetical protein
VHVDDLRIVYEANAGPLGLPLCVPFFDPPPPPPEPAGPDGLQPTGWRPPVWDRPSEAMLGVVVPVTLLLGRNDETALALDELRAYPNGFNCSLVALRNPMTPRDPMAMHRPMRMHPMMDRGPRLGFEFADGSRAQLGPPRFTGPPPGAGASSQDQIAILTTSMSTSTSTPPTAVPRPSNPFGVETDAEGVPLQPVLVPRGGGGGGDRYVMTYWCYPLPPPGPMTIHADWPDEGFDEVSIPFDADLLREAAARAITLWEPDE